MKKILVIAVLALTGLFIFSSCDTQKKCAAYGHYSDNVEVTTESDQI